MTSNCSLFHLKKCILTSYSLFVIYICTTFIVSAYYNTKPTHFTYLTVDLFAELHEPTKTDAPPHVVSYLIALESIVLMVLVLITIYVPDDILPRCPGGPLFALLQIVLTFLAIWNAKYATGVDAPVAVYFVLPLVTVTSIWFTYDLCNAFYDKRHENAQEIECDKVHNTVDVLVPINIRNQGRENAPNAEDEVKCV